MSCLQTKHQPKHLKANNAPGISQLSGELGNCKWRNLIWQFAFADANLNLASCLMSAVLSSQDTPTRSRKIKFPSRPPSSRMEGEVLKRKIPASKSCHVCTVLAPYFLLWSLKMLLFVTIEVPFKINRKQKSGFLHFLTGDHFPVFELTFFARLPALPRTRRRWAIFLAKKCIIIAFQYVLLSAYESGLSFTAKRHRALFGRLAWNDLCHWIQECHCLHCLLAPLPACKPEVERVFLEEVHLLWWRCCDLDPLRLLHPS